MIDMICEKTGTPCRHCSEEKHINISRVGVIKTGQMERRRTEIALGQFCNNDGKHFVRDLPACPVPEALSAPMIKHELSELDWMRRKGP
jgi:hypothetical protein